MLNPWVIKLNLEIEPEQTSEESGKTIEHKHEASFQVTALWMRLYPRMSFNVFWEQLVDVDCAYVCRTRVESWISSLTCFDFRSSGSNVTPAFVCLLSCALSNSSVWGLLQTPQLCRRTFTAQGCRMNEASVAVSAAMTQKQQSSVSGRFNWTVITKAFSCWFLPVNAGTTLLNIRATFWFWEKIRLSFVELNHSHFHKLLCTNTHHRNFQCFHGLTCCLCADVVPWLPCWAATRTRTYIKISTLKTYWGDVKSTIHVILHRWCIR